MKRIIFIGMIAMFFQYSSIAQEDTITQPVKKYKMSETDMNIVKKNLASKGDSLVLSETELENFKLTVENKVTELQNSIKVIGSKKEPQEVRDKAVQSALKLFIPDATMQVSNKTGGVKTFKMEHYFFRLMSLPYTRVEITFYDLAYTSNFYLGQDKRYHATATIFQEFKGFIGDEVAYTDRTIKTIDIILEYGEDQFLNVKRWIIKLGNIKVVETK